MGAIKRTLVVGWDGATWEVIRPLVEQGRLPHLARLMREGASGTLRSTTPPITPTAWTSLFTGKNPGKHGIFDFQEPDARYHFRTLRTDHLQDKTIWELLGDEGLTSMVVDVPFTYPPQPLRGWMITGYGTPRTPGTVMSYPANLADLLPAELRDQVRVAVPPHWTDRSLAFVEAWETIMAGRERLLQHLMTERPWDFFMVVFSVTDFMAHMFWTYLDPTHPNYARPEAQGFREGFFWAYERCDGLLGQMLEWAGGETTVLVLSDHGFGSVRPRQLAYQLLVEGGWLRYARPPVPLGDSLLRTAMRAYTGLPFLRDWVKRLRPGQQGAVKQALQRGGLLPGSLNVDFARSRVIPSNHGLNIWVNERGRFEPGVVEPADKPRLLDELQSFLLRARDPQSGERLMTAVHRGEAVYHGPETSRSPDLIIEWADQFGAPGAPGSNHRTEGGHTMDGIFLAHGPAIAPTALEGASLMDIAPTLLHLYDQPVPPDMDGRVLAEMLTDAHRAAHPIRQGTQPARRDALPVATPYTSEEEAELEEQLRKLGYI